MKTYIGIDIGKNGYIALYTPGYDNPKDQWDFFEIPKIGKEIDVKALSDLFIKIVEDYYVAHIGLENVHAIFGSSAGSTFEFGRVMGLIEAFTVNTESPYTKVAPKTWQKEMWQGIPLQKKPSSSGKTNVNDTKLNSLMAFKRLLPHIDPRRTERCKTPDDNKVDAALIALYIYRHHA